jgi:TRAP transporter 4TM/12TM fusion protein
VLRVLKRVQALANALFWLFGIGLSAYLAAAAFGYVRNSSEHYSNFIFGVAGMSGLVTVVELIDHRLRNLGAKDSWFWPRLAVAVVGTVLALWSAGYVRWHAVRLETIQPFFLPADFNMGLVFLSSILLLTWFHWGAIVTLMTAASVLYFFFGSHIPHPLLATPVYDPEFVMNYIGLGTNEGLFWFAREAADSMWFLVLFAGALVAIGSLRMVIEVGKAAGNRFSGGAAFPAIIGSGIVASIMGAAVSNVVLTGRLTIPMMKEKGYSAPMAGAIEATAGTAGQIMPPVLGLAAFIIAALLNIPYVEVALAAVIPGVLYMTGVTAGVLVYARRQRLPKLNEQVDIRLILRLLPAFVISFSVVMYLLVSYYSPSLAGLIGIVIALSLGLLQGADRVGWKDVVFAFRDTLAMAAILSLLLIAIGPLAQAFLTTNLGNRLGTVFVLLLPDLRTVLLIGAAVLALILGLGLPTPAAYIVTALAVVPMLQQVGVEPLMAHFFVFYFAVYSALTPPVAVASLAAAKIAKASIRQTTWESQKLMLTTFVIPFAFVSYPSLMSFPNLRWEVLIPLVTCLVLQWTVAIACYGNFRRDQTPLERALWGVISLAGYAALMDRGITSNLVFGAMTLAMAGYVYLTPETSPTGRPHTENPPPGRDGRGAAETAAGRPGRVTPVKRKAPS